jgi:hypothetical protein
MAEHYSTVNAGEQREALAKVIRLFERPRAPGGEDGGEYGRRSGEEKKKAGSGGP